MKANKEKISIRSLSAISMEAFFPGLAIVLFGVLIGFLFVVISGALFFYKKELEFLRKNVKWFSFSYWLVFISSTGLGIFQHYITNENYFLFT